MSIPIGKLYKDTQGHYCIVNGYPIEVNLLPSNKEGHNAEWLVRKIGMEPHRLPDDF